MDCVTVGVSQYIREKGISVAAVSENTGIPYNILYSSLCKNPRRKLRGHEFLGICKFIREDPMSFFNVESTGTQDAS